MGVHSEAFVIGGAEGQPIHLERHFDPEQTPSACVIVCHGFKGFKRWGFFPYLGRRLASAGFVALTFDFSHNGVGGGGEEFDRLDLFARNTTSFEVQDLARVVDWARRESPDAPVVADRPFGLVGHSRGGIPALVVGGESAQIGAVVLWNPVGRLLRYSAGQLRRWEEEGRMEFTNARTGQRMAMGFGFVVDAREHEARFAPAAAAGRLRAPLLVLHGEQDLAVDPGESTGLTDGGGKVRAREIIARGTHTFGAVHPFGGTTPELDLAVNRSLEWFSSHLGGARFSGP